MNQYKLTTNMTVGGTNRTEGDVVDLSPEEAATFPDGSLELVSEGAATAEAKPEGEADAPEAKKPEGRVLVQEDIEANPLLAELGAVPGTTLTLTAPEA